MASVMLTNNTAKKAIKVIPNIKESLIPSVLLCVTFAVLIIENMVFVVGDIPWYAHVSKLGRADLDGRPVYSVFYAEWLINVPILIVLAGSIALRRPAFEVAEPLIVTNVYIILAWVAHFIPSAPLRYAVVSLSFLMYFRASWSMCQWVRRWRRRNPKSFLLGRPLLSFVLIVVFGIYGIVYLGRMHGLVSYRGERIFFVTMDFTTKLLLGFSWVGACWLFGISFTPPPLKWVQLGTCRYGFIDVTLRWSKTLYIDATFWYILCISKFSTLHLI